MKNGVHKRGKLYHVRFVVNGRQIRRSLGTTVESEANVKARAIIKAAKSQAWQKVHVPKEGKPKAAATIGAVMENYPRVARARFLKEGTPQPRTVRDNLAQLRNVGRRAFGCSDDAFRAMSVTVLDRKASMAFADAMLADAGHDVTADRKRRESVCSTLQCAKSVFSQWALEGYEDEGLVIPPAIKEWVKYAPVKRPKRKYRMPPLGLVESTEKAGRALMAEQPDLYLVWLLTYELGMRAGEAAVASGEWLREMKVKGEKRYFLEVLCHGLDNPTKNDRNIRITPDTYGRLLRSAGLNGGFILPRDTPYGRENLVKRDFAAWMRSIGWDGYQKAAHELRKLAVCRWFTIHGLEVAVTWSGDSPATIIKWYAEFDPRRHPDPGGAAPAA